MHELARLFNEAGQGRFPPADGQVRALPPAGQMCAVVGFTAHIVVASSVPPAEIMGRLPAGDLGASMQAEFLCWLGQQLDREAGVLDLVMLRPAGGEGGELLVPRDDLGSHSRVRRARRYREGLAVYSDAGGHGVVTLGRGLAGRWEISVEVDEPHRGQGWGPRLVEAACALPPSGEPVYAQVAPGNARSVRAFLACGFAPVGSEVLFPPRRGPG